MENSKSKNQAYGKTMDFGANVKFLELIKALLFILLLKLVYYMSCKVLYVHFTVLGVMLSRQQSCKNA